MSSASKTELSKTELSKTTGAGIYIFAAIVVFFVIAISWLYMGMGADKFSKDTIEQAASKALGVSVSIDEMEINQEEKIIDISGVKIANAAGYKSPYFLSAEKVKLAVSSFDKNLIIINTITITGCKTYLEVNAGTTNQNDIVQQAKFISNRNKKEKSKGKQGVKIIIRNIVFDKPVIIPVATIVPTPYASVTSTDVVIRNIGAKKGGISIYDAIAEVVEQTVSQLNQTSVEAEFFKGMSLESQNAIGISTMDIFKKNVNNKIQKDMGQAKKIFNSIFGSGEGQDTNSKEEQAP